MGIVVPDFSYSQHLCNSMPYAVGKNSGKVYRFVDLWFINANIGIAQEILLFVNIFGYEINPICPNTTFMNFRALKIQLQIIYSRGIRDMK